MTPGSPALSSEPGEQQVLRKGPKETHIFLLYTAPEAVSVGAVKVPWMTQGRTLGGTLGKGLAPVSLCPERGRCGESLALCFQTLFFFLYLFYLFFPFIFCERQDSRGGQRMACTSLVPPTTWSGCRSADLATRAFTA